MKKSVLAVGGIVVVGAAVLFGGAAVSGREAEKTLSAIPALLHRQYPMLKVTDERYDRGLFSATYTFKLHFGCDTPGAPAAPDSAVTIVQHVKHGPLPGFSSVGAASVDTDVVMTEATRQQVLKTLGTAQPFTLHTDVAFSGATHTRFAIANLKGQDPTDPKGKTFAFQGLTLDVDNSSRSLQYDLRMPGFNVDSLVKVGSAHLHGAYDGEGALAQRPGKSEGELDAVEVNIPPSAAASDADAASSAMAADPSASAAAPVTAAPASGAAGGHKILLTKFKFTSDQTLDKGLTSGVMHLDGKVQVDDVTLDKIELQGSVKRMDVLTYQAMMQRAMGDGTAMCSGKPPNPLELLASPEGQASLLKMLAANPEMSLDKLAIESGGKHAELGYTIGVTGYTADDAKLPIQMAMLTRGHASAHIKLPEDWIQPTLAYAARQSGANGDVSSQMAMVEMMLGKVIDEGYVIRDNGMLRSDLAFQNGQATVNGKPLGGNLATGAAPQQ